MAGIGNLDIYLIYKWHTCIGNVSKRILYGRINQHLNFRNPVEPKKHELRRLLNDRLKSNN